VGEFELSGALCQELGHLLRESQTRLHHCLRQLDDREIWLPPQPGQNSVGVVIRHQCGNLRQWVICGLGSEPDTRDRQSEFLAELTWPREVLSKSLDATVAQAWEILQGFPAARWGEPRVIQGFEVTALGAVCHSVPHFVGHTHQVTQLTRWWRGENYRFHWDSTAPRTSVPL
jgi:hypothetical protein